MTKKVSKLKKAYALLIGVGNDLPVTIDDATAIKNTLADASLASYPPENIFFLTGKKATRKGILKAFDKLIAKVDEESSVLLFYSGHGGTYSDNTFLKEENWKPEAENKHYFHLIPYDYDPDNYEETWVMAEELKEKIQAIKSRRLVFFLDCCHAAGMVQTVDFSGSTAAKLSQPEGLAQRLDDGKGMSIITSCREDQQSYIMEGDKNSLYTKCMLEVLQGQHKSSFEDPYVRISEVIRYIFKKVPEENPEQNPYANLQIYDDFILSYIPEELRILKQTKESNTLIEYSKSIKKEVVTVFRETENANSVLLFVHGFTGEAATTFGEIPKFLIEDRNFDGWDMFPLGYSENVNPDMGKNVWASKDDILRISDFLSTSIKHKYRKYKRIAIVAHSLGGLVVQHALLNIDTENRNRISHLLLFGTPSAGLSEKSLKALKSSQLQELSENGSFIKNLRKQWGSTFNDKYPFSFKTVAAIKDPFVPTTSSLEPFAKENHNMVAGDHFSMVQAKDQKNDSFLLILNTLTNNEFYNEFTSAEEINILLGDYDAVIKKLLPQLENIDKKGLERLIMALEGMDREGEALKILKEHPLAKGNSNLMGVIGGRYKRKYLNSFAAEDATNAIKYYADGLQIAEAKDDVGQIYYNAINLAFLSLVYNDDKAEMNDYAQKAITAAEKDPFNSLWKLSTIAEGKLYKGELEEAKEYYEKAAKLSGLREKISIYTNAYKAYNCLMNTDSEEDPFIKFLKINFLS